MTAGIRRLGGYPCQYQVTQWPALQQQDEANPEFLPDVAVFYGLEGHLTSLFKYFRDRKRAAVYIDLGYWGRRDGGRWAGFHKIVVNARHPNAYFQTPARPWDRLERFGLLPTPWRELGRQGDLVLLGGMGDKGAAAEGFQPEEWERATYLQLREHTDRPILYRPKPSWKEAAPIQGMGYSSREQQLNWGHFRACVTHHSNLGVDSLSEGVGTFCWGGAAAPLASQDLALIESPPRVNTDVRLHWMSNLAYCQWNVDEMRQGEPWRFLLNEGLL